MSCRAPGLRSGRAAVGASALLAGLAMASGASPIAGQSFRGWVGSSLQMIQLRPVGVDTIAAADLTPDGDGGFLYDGYPVQCTTTSVCTGLFPRAAERTFAATQDAGLTFWGTGVRGLSATALVRVRSGFGGDVAWPRYGEDDFDALLAYAQLQRGDVRARAGRQEVRSGLGFSRFDGASASWDHGLIRLEAYGGRSLARGLREPANRAARALDDFFVDQGVHLFGGAATFRRFGLSLTGRYHRELLADRSGLDAERASIDFSTTLPRVRVTGSLDYDFSFERPGKAHLSVTAPMREGAWIVEVAGRRYVPYFELSTIWGFFEPVSYSEGYGRAAWSPGGAFGAWASGGIRSYGETNTPVVFQPLEDTGWWAEAGARWEPAAGWSVDGRYRIEWGVGAFLSSGDVSVRSQVDERLGVGVMLSAFQQIEEYRLGQGRAYAVGGDISLTLAESLELFGGFSVTRHRDGGTVFTSPWNQSRAWTSLRWRIGEDPGLANRRPR